MIVLLSNVYKLFITLANDFRTFTAVCAVYSSKPEKILLAFSGFQVMRSTDIWIDANFDIGDIYDHRSHRYHASIFFHKTIICFHSHPDCNNHNFITHQI